MSEMIKTIEEGMKNALRAKDSFRLGVLRLIKTELKNKDIELFGKITDADVNASLSKMIKQRKDSAEQYRNAARADMAENEEKEIVVIQEFLPKPLTDAEVDELIKVAMKTTGAVDAKGMGLVMKELKEPTSGRYDGKLLSDKVKAALTK